MLVEYAKRFEAPAIQLYDPLSRDREQRSIWLSLIRSAVDSERFTNAPYLA